MTRAPSQGRSTPSRTLHVLLAEDTPANQKLATYLLTGRGHAVEVAENGQQAVDRLRHESFDVVLMDVQMPVLDGLRATAAIRELDDPAKARIPIIALTAHRIETSGNRSGASLWLNCAMTCRGSRSATTPALSAALATALREY